MAPLTLELSQLEVEPLDVVVDAPLSERNTSLQTLTTQQEMEVADILLIKGAFFPPHNLLCCCCCVYPTG